MDLCNAGYLCVSDLPLMNGKIDFEQILTKVHNNGRGNIFLPYYALQRVFSKVLSNTNPASHLVHEELILTAKALFSAHNSAPLKLDNWFVCLQMMPLNKVECQNIFI